MKKARVTEPVFKKVKGYHKRGLTIAETAILVGLSNATISRIRASKTLTDYKDIVVTTAGPVFKKPLDDEPKELEKIPMIGYKAFDQGWKCRGMQYEVGKTFEHSGSVSLCDSGLHFVENPMDVFEYYPPTSKFAQVEAYGISDETSNDSKRAAKRLDIKVELSLHNLVHAGVKFILSKVDFENAKEFNTGDRSASTNTGNYSASTNTGDRSAATNTGYRSAATNTGYRSAATNTGDRSAATNTGFRSAATNTGDRSASTNTGNYSASTIEGKDGVAIVTGYGGKASGKLSCWLVLTDRDFSSGKIKEVRAVEVDGEKIKEDTFYMLKDGKVIEA